MRNYLIVAAVGVLVATGASHADLPDTSETSCEITSGGSFDSELEANSDVDWCQFTILGGRNYGFRLELADTEGASFTLERGLIEVVDQEGTSLSTVSDDGRETYFLAPADGVAFVSVSGGQTGSVGSYRVQMSTADDYRGDFDTTAVVVPGQVIEGEFEASGDQDWFVIDLPEGMNQNLRLQGGGNSPDLTLFGGGQRMERYDPETETWELTGGSQSFNGNASGRTYFRFVEPGFNPFVGTYRLLFNEADEAAESGPHMAQTAAGLTQHAALQQRGDVDSFIVQLEADKQYELRYFGAGYGDLNSTSLCLQTVSPSGAEVSIQYCGGFPTLYSGGTNLKPEESGEWVLRITHRDGGSMNSERNPEIPSTYALSVSPPDDFTDTFETVGIIEPGFFATGVIQAERDVDWFKVPMIAGEPVTIHATGAQSSHGTLELVRFSIHDLNGQVVGGGTVMDGNAMVTITPEMTGDYAVGVYGQCTSFPDFCHRGSYRVSVSAGNSLPNTTGIFAATLPQARAVRRGGTATLFASILNSGDEIAQRCGVALNTAAEIGFQFSATNAQNQVVGEPNARVDIAPGERQGFVLALTPMADFSGESLDFAFDCANSAPAPVAAAVNGFSLAADNSPLSDIIMIAASPSNDGVARIPGADGTGFFTVAAINIGSEETLTFSATASGEANVSPVLCETDPGTGACLAALAGNVERTVANGEVVFFSVFFAGGGETVPFDPAETRIRFNAEVAGALRGATSVAVATD